jgi:hypothetical protein
MENPEKTQTMKSAELAEPIRHIAAITVLLDITDHEIANSFQLSLDTLADWKRRPEWQETSVAFAKAHFAPWFKKYMKGRLSRQKTRQMILDLIRSTPPALRFGYARALSGSLAVERVRCKTAKKQPKALSWAKKSAKQPS